jgi:hypothetical protein
MATHNIKFPSVRVEMVGEDGNAFAIIGRVQRAMKRGGCTANEISEFVADATGGDYDNLLAAVLRTVTVENHDQARLRMADGLLRGQMLSDMAIGMSDMMMSLWNRKAALVTYLFPDVSTDYRDEWLARPVELFWAQLDMENRKRAIRFAVLQYHPELLEGDPHE